MPKLVIIGSGSGGLPIASTIAKIDRYRYDITVITRDSDIAYSPCGIPFVLKGDIASYKNLIMQEMDHYEQLGITILTDTEVKQIDAHGQHIRFNDAWHAYDYLVIATGTAQKLPRIQGTILPGVFSAHIKTLRDGERFQEFIEKRQGPLNIIITGSGSIDLEFAVGLKHLGHRVFVVEQAAYLMPDRLDADMAVHGETYLKERDIEVITGQTLREITGSETTLSAIFDRITLPADVILLGTDFIPETTLARDAGFDTDRSGIIVDGTSRVLHRGKTVPNVFASGACARSISKATGRPDLMYFGSTSILSSRIIAEQLLGKEIHCNGRTNPRIAVLWGLHIGTVGITSREATAAGMDVIHGVAAGKNTARYYPGGETVYLKLLFEKSTLRLVGAQVISRGRGVKGRVDALAIAMHCSLTARDLVHCETAYSPPASPLVDVVTRAAWMVYQKYL